MVACKIDLEDERKVTKEEAQALADQYGISYYETSAKLNVGLEEAFEDLFEKSYTSKFGEKTQESGAPDEGPQERKQSMRLGTMPGKKKKKGGCCK